MVTSFKLLNKIPYLAGFEGLKVLNQVEGGGDSLFMSLWITLENLDHEEGFAADHFELRTELIDHIIENPTRL